MNIFARHAVTAAACLIVTSVAQAKVKIEVDLDTQTMHVQGAARSFDTKVSSGKPGFETPAGDYKVLWMDKDHHSDTYDGAFMPDAIFFAPGYAIHGFGKSPWGHKASHGCIRIPAAKAAVLFDMVKAEGADITITGATSAVAPTVASINARNRQREQTADADTQPDDVAGYLPPPEPRYGGPGYAQAPTVQYYQAPQYDSFY